MPGMDGIEATREIRLVKPDLPVIFHTGFPGEYQENRIDKEEQPFDYITKGESIDRLKRSIRNAVREYKLITDCKKLSLHAEDDFGIIGRSEAMQEVFKQIQKASNCDLNVMILGETGTGKELVARAMHKSSDYDDGDGNLAILNCNHKAPDLIEAELFGVEKEVFTNVRERVGLFEYANGGTIFLDEIADLDITTQAKILRAVEYGEYQKLGDPKMRKTRTRVICATNQDIKRCIEDGRFREDLFQRLNAFILRIPPLRDRKEDVPLLVKRFNERYCRRRGLIPKIFHDSAMDLMLDYEWPGNVRQLLNVVETTLASTNSDLILAEDLKPHLGSSLMPSNDLNLSRSLKQHERTTILKSLARSNYVVKDAAELLGIDRANLHRKIREHGIDLSSLRDED
jgi:two-component system response regulator HydG/two-component system response regulator AtoC